MKKFLILISLVLLNACSEKSPVSASKIIYTDFTGRYAENNLDPQGIIPSHNHIFKDSVYIHYQYIYNANYLGVADSIIRTIDTFNMSVNIPEQTMKIYNDTDTLFMTIKKFDEELLLEGNSITIKGVKYY